jgi:ribonuclease-3
MASAASATGGSAPASASSTVVLSGVRTERLQTFAENTLGHRFTDLGLLKAALTHSSALPPSHYSADVHLRWERLAWLGDKVLNLLVGGIIFDKSGPAQDKGDLTAALSAQVNRDRCKEIAMRIGLDDVLEGITLLTKNVLAETVEAIIGAMYEDGGLEPCAHFVNSLWFAVSSEPIGDATGASSVSASGPAAHVNPVNELQEWAQKRGHPPPDYIERYTTGPDHELTHHVRLYVYEDATTIGPEHGEGPRASDADMQAAAKMMMHLRARPGGLGPTSAEAQFLAKVQSDPVSACKELADKQRVPEPRYTYDDLSGTNNGPFRCEATWMGRAVATAAVIAPNKRMAKCAAARLLLEELGYVGDERGE